MRWFTSDLHFGHKNVIQYSKRPYKDTDEMNRALITNWNARITILDEVYFLGDWSLNNPKFYKLLLRLNFAKLYWIAGNHDKRNKLEQMLSDEMPHLKDKVQVMACCYLTLSDGKQYYLIHRPILARDDMPSLCGHVHEKWTYLKADSIISEHSRRVGPMPAKNLQQPVLNVGVDVHNWVPISEDEVVEFFKADKYVGGR